MTTGAFSPWLIGILLAIVAYFLRTIHMDLRALSVNFQKFSLKVAENYATKLDLHEAKDTCSSERRRLHGRIDDLDERFREAQR